MTDTALRLITAFKAAKTQDEYDSVVADLYGSDLPTRESARCKRNAFRKSQNMGLPPLSPESMSPLDGFRMRLDRKSDRKDPCCSEFGVVHVRDTAEIWCEGCNLPRGELPREAVEWLLNLFAHFPAARESTPILRDHDPNFVPLRPREREKVSKSARRRKEAR